MDATTDPNRPRDPATVCRECLEKTKIRYVDKGRFFMPHFKSINHLEVGYSKIISNPLTLMLEWVMARYFGMRDSIRRFWAWLFPRRDRIYGQTMDSWLVGRIIFSDKTNGEIPIHHLPLEFWARTWFGQWRKLSQGHTLPDGTFRLPFELKSARRFIVRKLRFEIYQLAHAFHDGQKATRVHQLFKTIPVSKGDLIGMEYNLRTLRLVFWEYRKDVPMPRVVILNHNKDAPQYYTDARVQAMNEQMIPVELTKVKHLVQIKKDPDSISLQEIQDDYPLNLTGCIEKVLPGYTRGDDWFGERMMNGMNRGLFMPDPDEPGTYWMKYFGKMHYDANDEYAFPDAMIQYRLKPDGLPIPIKIRLRGPLNAIDKDPWQERTFTPADGEFWLYAKRIARVNGGLCTEVDEHFAGTHANVEQYAIAAYRNLRHSPLAELLFPHLKEVALINHAADSILLKQYIPHATALTYEGLVTRVADMLGVMDWKSYRTPEPLSAAHTSARAEKLFWEITMDFVNYFIDANIDSIRKHWHEVYAFSEDLVNHSVPIFLSDVDMAQMDPRDRDRFAEMKTYISAQFSFDDTLPRQTRYGQLKTVSPITLTSTLDPVREQEEIALLKQACTYMIFVATYLHTWANEHQYEDIGEVLYNCLGLRYGDKPSGILAPESDLTIAPDLTRSTQMMWFSNLLSRTEYGFITRNEDQDVHPYFSSLLMSKKDDFAALGVKVEDIESRTNI